MNSTKEKIRSVLFGPLSIFFNPSHISSKGLLRTLNNLTTKYHDRFTGKVMDFGCGSKPYRSLFPSQEYIGLDTQKSGHEHNYLSKVDVYYDGDKVPFPDAHFDSVVSFQVLEHVPHFSSSFSEIVRITKKKGTILISVPFVWYEHEEPYDFRRFTSFEIKKLEKEFGLRLLEAKKTTHALETITQQLCTYLMLTLKTPSAGLNLLLNLILISPVTITGMIFGAILPKNHSLYLDIVAVFEKE